MAGYCAPASEQEGSSALARGAAFPRMLSLLVVRAVCASQARSPQECSHYKGTEQPEL